MKILILYRNEKLIMIKKENDSSILTLDWSSYERDAT